MQLLPAFTKLRQSTRDLPEPDTDVGILHEKPHSEFRRKNFAVRDGKLSNMWADNQKRKMNERIKTDRVTSKETKGHKNWKNLIVTRNDTRDEHCLY